MSELSHEPSLEPPDEPSYCQTPDCDQCRIPLYKCPGTDPAVTYE